MDLRGDLALQGLPRFRHRIHIPHSPVITEVQFLPERPSGCKLRVPWHMMEPEQVIQRGLSRIIEYGGKFRMVLTGEVAAATGPVKPEVVPQNGASVLAMAREVLGG